MTELAPLIGRLQGKRVMIVGDVMLDHYTFGTVSRISPEAPVPVVLVNEERRLLGGAGNVARNIVALGGAATLIGAVGADADGELLSAMLEEASVQALLVRDARRRTTRKTRIIAQNQQIVRIDREDDGNVAAETLQKVEDILLDQGRHTDIIIVSDYGKGMITPEVMATLGKIREQNGNRTKILVDPKPLNYDLYRGVDILTPNAKEAAEGAGPTGRGKPDAAELGRALFRRLQCKSLLITLGSRGMAVFPTADECLGLPTFARKVYDVTGAGDTVIATLALGLAAGADLVQAALLANHAAGIVVGQVGASAPSPAALLQAVVNSPKYPIRNLG